MKAPLTESTRHRRGEINGKRVTLPKPALEDLHQVRNNERVQREAVDLGGGEEQHPPSTRRMLLCLVISPKRFLKVLTLTKDKSVTAAWTNIKMKRFCHILTASYTSNPMPSDFCSFIRRTSRENNRLCADSNTRKTRFSFVCLC